MNFCSECGHRVVVKIPAADSRPRFVCENCQTIHYQNPKVICGCIATWQDRILLCRRAIEPRHGFWTLPAGFMENGESCADGARRETLEEAQARVGALELYCLFDIPHIHQIHLMYRGELADADIGAGSESLESVLFAEADLPWLELAFPSIQHTLAHFIRDRRNGAYPLHSELLAPPSWEARRPD